MKYMKFSPELVPLVQDGTKTVTRRPIKPQPKMVNHIRLSPRWFLSLTGCDVFGANGAGDGGEYIEISFPYGQPGTTIQSDAGPLEIVSVKVERVQDIDIEDALDEGMTCEVERYRTPVDAFAAVWNNIYGHTEHNWDADPWVWVIEFKAVTP